MADKAILHVHNTEGLPVIEVGAHEFMCIGAEPPFDHPHVFLTFGGDKQIVCPYCSTLYVYNPELGPHATNPPSAVWKGSSADVAA
ncbi:MAG: zinc-finger domain-containing protein [Cohaesibacteraceae bacterium]